MTKSKTFKLLLLLLLTTPSLLQDSCESCKCYALNCNRIEVEEDSDSTETTTTTTTTTNSTTEANSECKDTYRDTCDNSNDILPGTKGVCNKVCHCCLSNNCFKWFTYPCIMFRTFDFFHSFYFVFILVNAFALWKVFKIMFSKEKKRIPDHDEDEEDAEDIKKLQEKNKKYEAIMKFSGMFRIRKIPSYFERIDNKEHKRLVGKFFEILSVLNKDVGSRNYKTFWFLFVMYVLQVLYHIFNAFYLWNKPMIYIWLAWIQHLMLTVFWITIYYSLKKGKLYIKEVRKLIIKFKDDERVVVKLHEKGNRIDFLFKDKI